MSKKYLTYSYRVYPNKKQRELIFLTFESCREVYNIVFKDTLKVYNKFKKYINYCVLKGKESNEEKFFKRNKIRKISQVRHLHADYMKVDSLALVSEKNNVINGFKRFFEGSNAFPKYKRRNDKNTYVTSNVNNNIRIENGKIRIPKVGMVKAKLHRELPLKSKIKKAVVKEDKCGKFYIGLVVEFEDIKEDNNNFEDIIGLDFKVGEIFVDNNGYTPNYAKPYRMALTRLKKIQEMTQGKTRFSNQYNRIINKIRRLHKYIANLRADILHKVSNWLTTIYNNIVVETLSIIDIAKKLKSGINTYDTSYNKFINMIKYKIEGKLIFVDKWFPSSKLCSNCGNRKKKLKLDQRVYKCHVCGMEMDRDRNAAKNIKKEGLKLLKLRN